MARPCWLVVALVAAGCAGQTQTSPVYRDSTPAAVQEPETERVVHEEFDPARFREDLLLVQPVFPPPEVASVEVEEEGQEPVRGEPPAVESPTGPPGAIVDAGSATDTSAVLAPNVMHRVQVIALSQRDRAERIASELQRRFDVPTDVVPLGSLFAVRAGGEPTRDQADALRQRITALSRAYESAYLVTEEVPVIPDLPVTQSDVGPDSLAATDSLAAPPDLPVFEEEPLPEPEPELVLMQGYRVLLGQFLDLTSAQDDRTRVINRLKRDDVEVKFEAPWYKVLAGSFRTASEAQQFAERCRRLGYRTAAPVRGEVYLPKEGGSR
jgi:cell division septation protein DedD